jgi:hypothetical protein
MGGYPIPQNRLLASLPQKVLGEIYPGLDRVTLPNDR